MNIYNTNHYEAHGLNIRGNLFVVDYYEAMTSDPRWGGFGQCVCYDYIEKAKAMITEHLSKPFIIKLTMPVFIVHVEE